MGAMSPNTAASASTESSVSDSDDDLPLVSLAKKKPMSPWRTLLPSSATGFYIRYNKRLVGRIGSPT